MTISKYLKKEKMTITLNNRTETINADKLSVSGLLNHKNFTFKLLIVKLNGRLIKKDKFSETLIKEGDKVDVIHMISGG